MSDVHRDRDPVSYRYGAVITPFVTATQEWDNSLGIWRQRAYRWRVCCLGVLAGCLLLLLLLIWLCSVPRNSVLALQVTQNGFVSQWGWLTERYTIPDQVTEGFAAQYLVARYSDNAAARAFAQQVTNPSSWSALPVGVSYAVRVVKIETIAPMTIQAIWQVARNTGDAVVTTYQGTLVLNRQPIKDRALLQQNPLGFYVKQFRAEPLSAGKG